MFSVDYLYHIFIIKFTELNDVNRFCHELRNATFHYYLTNIY